MLFITKRVISASSYVLVHGRRSKGFGATKTVKWRLVYAVNCSKVDIPQWYSYKELRVVFPKIVANVNGVVMQVGGTWLLPT